MIKILTVIIAITAASWGHAQSQINLDVDFPIPEVREDGTPLDSDDIEGYNLYVIEDEELAILSTVTGPGAEVIVPVDEEEGVLTVCLKTVGKLIGSSTNPKESNDCSDTVEVPFVVAPPGAPLELIAGQSLDININVNVNVNTEEE